MGLVTIFGRPATFLQGPVNNPVVGQYYYDTNTMNMFVYDGNRWVEISSGPSDLSHWSDVHLSDEDVLCEKHPGLAELKKELEEAKEKFEAFKALVKE